MIITSRSRLSAIMLIAIVSLLGLNANAQTPERGRASLGPKVGFVSRNVSATAGITFEYSFSKHVRIAPEVGVIFRHKDLDGFAADVNVHFPIDMSAKAAFYPLVGVGFTSWGRHREDAEGGKDVTSHISAFGINAGAGFEYYCTSSLKLSLEARYTLMKHYPTAYVTAGIAFVF
ncbi:MAG: outer membrane beta-barrel protein [Muribaculaceae bacterium]|nr:outer membrane beta-barrel protein [Muribaculaceae bacterium]